MRVIRTLEVAQHQIVLCRGSCRFCKTASGIECEVIDFVLVKTIDETYHDMLADKISGINRLLPQPIGNRRQLYRSGNYRKDKRLGKYLLTVIFKGDDDHMPAETTAEIDFGSRPAPALPAEAVLIGSGPALVVALPFLAFYGSCWVVFFYCLGWLAIIKMRNCKSD